MKKFDLSFLKEKDKVNHILFFFALTAFISIAVKGGTEWSNIKCALIALVAAEVIGVAKELYDKHVKGKFIDWKDIVANSVGCLVGLLFALLT